MQSLYNTPTALYGINKKCLKTNLNILKISLPTYMTKYNNIVNII